MCFFNMELSKEIFSFFKDLKKNNNRDWFTDHKSHFKSLEQQVKTFGEQLKDQLNTHDSIYRDVRFSKDKTPFKTHFGLTWHRTKPHY